MATANIHSIDASIKPSDAVPPQPSRDAALRTGWPAWLGALLLLFITLAAYRPAMRAGFIWDDDAYVYKTDANVIVPFDGLKRIWTQTSTSQWYPMVFTTFWIEYRLWGNTENRLTGKNEPQADGKPAWFNPTGYHVVNIILHALTAIFVWRILVRLGVPGAWLAAAIFALHPVQVESVAWITERKNTLSGFFYMVSVLAYLRFARRGEGWYWLALVAFVAALLSKSVTCSLPVAVILLLWLTRERVRPTVWLGLIPFFILGLIMARMTSWYEFHKLKDGYFEPMPIQKAFLLSWQEGAESQSRSEYGLSFPQRTMIASRSLLFYAKKLVVPYPLSFFYYRWNDPKQFIPGHWMHLDPSNLVNFWPVAVVFGLGVLVVGLSAMFGRGIFVGCFFFAMTLFPALGFFDTYPMRYSFVADHFQYLACLGLITLAAAGLAMLFGRVGRSLPVLNGATAPGGVLAIVLLAALGVGTYLRCRVYVNEEKLWLDTIAKTPTAWGARVNLAILYANEAQRMERRGEKEKAERLFDKAAEQFQAMIDGGSRWQEAPSNLGNIYALRKDFARAEQMFRMAVEFEPRLANLWMRLAKTLTNQKKHNEALAVYEQAAKVPPESYVWREEWPRLFKAWAELLEGAGRTEDAAKALARAEEVRKMVATRPAAPKRQPTATAAAPDAPIDLGGVTDPRERRRAFIAAADAAMMRRDYGYMMRVLRAGLQEHTSSSALWRKYVLLLAATPVELDRDAKEAIDWGERLRDSLSRVGQLDQDALEGLAAGYAEAGRFDDAVKTVQEALKMPALNSGVTARLQAQLKLYQARKPYRLPLPLPDAPRAPATRAAPAMSPPAATRTVTVPATRPL